MLLGLLSVLLLPLTTLASVLGYFGIPAWLVYTTAVLVPTYFYLTWNFDRWRNAGVGGPKPLPFFGNMFDVIGNGFCNDMKFVNQYGKYLDPWRVFEGRKPVLVVCDPEVIKELAIKKFEKFMNRRTEGFPMQKEMKGAVSVVKGEEWKGMRSVITPTFSASKMKKMSRVISDCGMDFVKALDKVSGQEVDIKRLSGNFTTDVIGRTMFGITVNSQEEVNNPFVLNSKKAFDDMNFMHPKFLAMVLLPAALMAPIFKFFNVGVFDTGAVYFFRDSVQSVLRMRKEMKEKPNDFLQLLLEAHETEMGEADKKEKISALESTNETYDTVKDWRVGKRALTEDEIMANAIIFFMVGYETTASALSFMLNLLAHSPDIQQRVYEEIHAKYKETDGHIGYEEVANMPYLDQVFCETLRLYPAAPRSDRVCNETTEIGGVKVLEGEIVNMGIMAIHHNPEYWEEPEKFDPDRFSPENKPKIVPYSWIPFGSPFPPQRRRPKGERGIEGVGPRNCVGMRLAIMEAKIGAAYVLNSFKFAPSPNSEVNPM